MPPAYLRGPQTVDHQQPRVVLPGCTGKEKLSGRRQAAKIAARQGCHAYHCPHCGSWHTGSGVPAVNVKKFGLIRAEIAQR